MTTLEADDTDGNGDADDAPDDAPDDATPTDTTTAADDAAAAADEPYTFEDLSVVMGTYNEEAAIATVLSDIDDVTDGRAEVVCVDGSDDRTPAIAEANGARVIRQEPQGYGVAVAAALSAASRDVIVTTDCDDTYPMAALPEFLAAINDGADVVSGDRLYHGAAAMPALNRVGNHAFAALSSLLVGERVHDTTTGMRAYRREVIEAIELTENTGLSAELLLRPLARGYDVRERPIAYGERAGETKLDPLTGGAEIATSILRVCLQERL
jgi:glycosyltransferase involved in cell wall biosynthesis